MKGFLLLFVLGLFSCQSEKINSEIQIGLDNELFKPLNSCDYNISSWLNSIGQSSNRIDISLYDSLHPSKYRIDIIGYNFCVDSIYFFHETELPSTRISSEYFSEHFNSLSNISFEKISNDSIVGTLYSSWGSIGFRTSINAER